MTSASRWLYLTLVACGIARSVIAADENVVFRSDVSLVRVDAQVVDRDNRAITGLRAQDFILREEGRPQQIRNFATENLPVDFVLLLDVSASMRTHVERIASAAHEAFQVLGKDDRVAIMVFDRSTRLRLPFRSNHDDVEREFQSLLDQETFNGGTDITRGLLDAVNYVSREARPNARRAIVILTDDQTERNRDVEGVSRALTRADAVLSLLLAPDAMQGYHGRSGGQRGGGGTWPGGGPGLGGPLGGIILGRRGPGSGGPGMRGPHTQSAGSAEIARRSGGDSLPVDDASALETTLERIRQRYALHFNLPPDVKAGQERNIEVALADTARQRYPGADVRYRRVYYAPNGAGAAASGGGEPAEVSRIPVNPTNTSSSASSDQPTLRRRPGVNQPDGRGGPSMTSATPETSSDTPPQSSWRRTNDPATAPPAANAPPKTAKDPDCGGWRRVDQPESTPCPADSNTPPKPKPDQQP